MNIIGNVFLSISTLLFFGIAFFLFSKESSRSDAAAAYVWTMIFFHVTLLICLAIVAGIIAGKGGFAWVGSSGISRFLLVGAGLVLAVVGSCVWAFFKFDKEPGMALLRLGSNFMPVLIPLLLIVGGAILLNDTWRSAVSVTIYEWPLMLAAAMGALGVVVLALVLFVQEMRNTRSRAEADAAFEEKNHQNYLDIIDSTDVMKGIADILGYTDANHYPDVRERALARIQSRPDWQEEIARCLKTDAAPKAFTFLASNEVNDQKLFAEPLREGVLIQAKLIRESIRNCRGDYDLYPERFSWEVDRVLRTLEKFKEMGVDYRPALQEMRAALDEPTDFEKPKLYCRSTLDNWLKNH